MRRDGVSVVVMAGGMSGLLLLYPSLFAAEHGGKEQAGTATKEHGGTAAPQAKEHGGLPAAPAAQVGTTQEHGGLPALSAVPSGTGQAGAPGAAQAGQAVQAEPSAEQIRQAIESYVKGIEAKDGAFAIQDELTGATRKLTFVRVHERVGKTGDFYYSCTDMRDTATGELLDLDFDVDAANGQLNVVDTRLHKVAGQARYTYDDQDNRIPLPPAGRERTY